MHHHSRQLPFLTVCVFLMALSWPVAVVAQSEVKTGIRETYASRIPLLVSPFSALDGTRPDHVRLLEQIVTQDLQFSGVFNLRSGNVPVSSTSENLVEVRGALFLNGGSPHFEGRVIDVSTKQRIGGKRYPLGEAQIRQIAHHFADEVVKMLTGENGVASTRIMYRQKKGDQWEVVMADYDGYNPRVLLRQTVPLICPRWIEGQKGFVYTSYRYGQADLFQRYLQEAASKKIASYPGLNYSVDWSDARNEMVATLSKDGNAEIYILGKGGDARKRLTHNNAIDTSPRWSPSGREIVFTSDRSGTPQIYIMEADGSNVRRLSYAGSYCDSPAWSPKGDLIAFVSRIDGFFQIFTVRPDGSDLRQLTVDAAGHEDPSWAPSGRHIAFSEKQRGESVISVIDIGTGGKRILSKGDLPDWSSH